MRLNLYDSSMNRIAFIDESFISCLWAENYNSKGSLSLELPLTEEYKELVKPDCYVGRWDRDTVMVIKSVLVRENSLVATGSTADRQLDDVAFVGTIGANSNVASALKTAYEGTDGYPNFSFATSSINVAYPSQISNKSIGELLETMCQGADLGYKAVKAVNGIEIQFYRPSANDNLKFSSAYGNLQDMSLYHSTEPYKNYAVVLGEGDETLRTRVDVDIRRSTTEQKREMIIDARDIQTAVDESQADYYKRLQARGVEKLLEQKEED